MEPAAGIVASESPPEAPNVIFSEPAVSIYCIYSANPFQLVPNSTRWFKDGQLLELAESRLVESTTATGYPTLTFKQVHRRDSGRYDCQLSNSVGPSERLPGSEAARLEVNFRPSVRLRLFRAANSSEEGPLEELGAELEPSQELILPGARLVLLCEVIEARPQRIHKFQWLSSGGPPVELRLASGRSQLRQLAVSEANQFRLGPLAADLAASSFACSAANSLGQSEPSNQIELQLSRLPGKSPSIVVVLQLAPAEICPRGPIGPGGTTAEVRRPGS